MKKFVLGLVIGISISSFAYILSNPQLPSMVGITDTSQITLTKADEIINDPFTPGMNITAADFNAKFHSLNMNILKLKCDNQNGIFEESSLSCSLPKTEVISHFYSLRFSTGIFQLSRYKFYKEDFLNNSLGWQTQEDVNISSLRDGTVNTINRPTTTVRISMNFDLPTDQISCENISGTWEFHPLLGNACSITNLDEETCKSNGFVYREVFNSGVNATTVDTSSSNYNDCLNNDVQFGFSNGSSDFMSESENLNRLDNYNEILELYDSL